MKPLVPISLIALSVAVFYMYISPTYADIRGLESEVGEYHSILSDIQTLEGKKAALVDQYNVFTQNDLERLEKMVPRGVDNVRLIAEINGIGERRGIVIKSTNVQESRQSPVFSEEGVEEFPSGYRTVTFSFSFDATYDTFIQFVSDLESNLRITDFSHISFSSDSGAPKLTYQVTLKTYWLP